MRVLKPDTVLKNYWNDNERFADFFNAVLFHGEQRIFPEELEELDTEESTVLEHREYAESIAACDSGNGKSGTYSLCHANESYGI